MKKLMIALAAVATAAVSQAATVNWNMDFTSGKAIYVQNNSTLYSGGAYIFCQEKTAQETLVTALYAGTLDLSSAGYVAEATLSSGVFNNPTTGATTSWSGTVGASGVDYVEGNSYNFYVALVKDGNLFISKTVGNTALEGDVNMTLNPQLASQRALYPANSTFAEKGAGWYQAAAVPEPTSGLLLLLGVAGLALRRRRA